MRDGSPCSPLIGVVHLHATNDHAHEERREEGEVGDQEAVSLIQRLISSIIATGPGPRRDLYGEHRR
jgi:hypothetical protein